MLGTRKLILDTHCEIYSMIKHLGDGIFWNFRQHVDQNQLTPGAIYIIGREQLRLNQQLIRDLVTNNVIKVVFSNPAEGSETMMHHCGFYGILDLVQSGQIPIITGGDQDPTWQFLQYESFLPKVLDYNENLVAIDQYQAQSTTTRPYKFLFLNGRARPHRRYLIERFRLSGLLDQAIWSNLDSKSSRNAEIALWHQGRDLLNESIAIQYLDPQYEVDLYHDQIGAESQDSFVKPGLFKNDWGEIYLKTKAYLDSYFSLVTETVYSYPYTFRTEKIWKPIAIGHPFIVAASAGYYRDLHRMGFRTFGHLIDESFDQIANSQDRIERTSEIVEDLCRQDLADFIEQAQDVCKYNQQHLAELRPGVRQQLPEKFINFVKACINE